MEGLKMFKKYIRKDCFTCIHKMLSVRAEPCKSCVSLTDHGDKFPKWEGIE